MGHDPNFPVSVSAVNRQWFKLTTYLQINDEAYIYSSRVLATGYNIEIYTTGLM